MMTGHALPHSIAEIARRVADGSQLFDFAVREFLDGWQTMDEATKRDAIFAEPCNVNRVQDAYLAALAEYLAQMDLMPVPDWSERAL